MHNGKASYWCCKENNMEDYIPFGISAYDSDGDTDVKLLREYDKFIRTLVRQKIPRNRIPAEVLDLEIHDLEQNVRVKLWLQLQKHSISNPKAYISRIVYTETVDLVRRYKPVLPLPVDEDGELYQGIPMVIPGEGMQDPAYELECEEMALQYIKKMATALLQLSRAEQKAVICSLKDCKDDGSLLLLKELKARAIPIEAIEWPTEKKSKQSLRVALSHARKKLRFLLEADDCIQASTSYRNVAYSSYNKRTKNDREKRPSCSVLALESETLIS
jgi:DNA-directed RNA polymerase specialized sigma24 family protein